MKIQAKWILTFLITLILSLGISCKVDADVNQNKKFVDVTDFDVVANDGMAVLSWTEPTATDFLGVEISMNPAIGMLANPVKIVGTNAYIINGLEIGGKYQFTVKAYNKNGHKAEGLVKEVTVGESNPADTTAPGEVSEFNVSAANGTALLSWINPTDEDLAAVQISLEPAAGTLANPIFVGKNVTNYTVYGLTVGQEYSFIIKTADKSLNFSEGSIITKVVEDTSDKVAPGEIENLVSIPGNSNVLLNWRNPTDEDLKSVQISMEPATGTLLNPVYVGKNVETFIVTGLEAGEYYTIIIKTVDSSLNYSEGKTISVSSKDASDTVPPDEVSDLSVEAINGRAVLSWTKPKAGDFYAVQISMLPAVGTLESPIILLEKATKFEIHGLTNGEEYEVTIKSLDNNLNTSQGIKKKFYVDVSMDETSPNEVTELTVTAKDTKALLQWSLPEDEDLAYVRVSAEPAEGTLKYPVFLTKDVTSFDVYGLTNDTEYTFMVRTIDSSLNPSEGKTTVATPQSTKDTTPPAEVSSCKVTTGDETALLTWTNPPDSDFAYIRVSMEPATGTLSSPVFLQKGVASFSIYGLSNGTEYTFMVRTIDNSLNPSEGIEVKGTPLDSVDTTPPAEVTDFTVGVSDSHGKLTWTNPVDADFAYIRVSMEPAEGTLANPVFLRTDIESFEVYGLENGTEYTFMVRTIDNSLNPSEGVKKTGTPLSSADTIAPADVTNLTATNKDESVLLTWTDATDEDVYGYEVSYAIASSELSRAFETLEENTVMVAPGTQECLISSLTNDTEYSFTVKSVDTSGNKSAGVTKVCTPTVIEKSPLEIILKPSTTEFTNQDIVVTVSAVSDAGIKTIKYVEGINYNIDEVLKGTDITDEKTFTVVDNGGFTVAATDTDGRREVQTITINNIDKKAPITPNDLYAFYTQDNEIYLSWRQTYGTPIKDENNKVIGMKDVDPDFVGTKIVYGKTDSEMKEIFVSLEDSLYDEVGPEDGFTAYQYKLMKLISDIPEDGSEYTIKVFSEDKYGNVSTHEGYNVTTVNATAARINEVSIDRSRIDSETKDRDITVNVAGENFNCIGNLLWYYVYLDGEKNPVIIDELTLDVEGNTATGTFAAPVPDNPTVEGTKYNVEFFFARPYEVIDVFNSKKSTSFVVTTPAQITEAKINDTELYTFSDAMFTINGTNLDLLGSTRVDLLNESNVVGATTTLSDELKTNETSITFPLNLPEVAGKYTTAIYINEKKVDITTPSINVYTAAEIESIEIPTAGISYAGESLPVTILGKNFDAPDFNDDNFVGEGGTFSNFKKISNTKVTAEVVCPSTVGETAITLAIGASICDGTITVVGESECFAVGDILFTDGTRIKASELTESTSFTDDEKTKAFAVVAYTDFGGGTGYSVGKVKGTYQPWAKYTYLVGYDKVESLVESVTATSSTFPISQDNDYTAYFTTGDTDGSDNWDLLCIADPEGTKDPATNYPAFNYALNYGTTNGLSNFEDGWYLPSIIQLFNIYKNYETVQTSLTLIGGLLFVEAAGSNANLSYYYSSSQSDLVSSSDDFTDCAYTLAFGNNYVYGNQEKNYGAAVIAVNAFGVDEFQ